MSDTNIIRAGVVGHPISHSLSPYIHGYWLEKYGINGSYDAFEVAPDDLKAFLNSMPDKGFNGVNLTLPHKVAALDILGNVDPFAQFIGAVNTVIINDGYFLGTNTDFLGFVRNIETTIPDFAFDAGRAVVLGAGGAARAVVFALATMKCPEIIIVNRSIEKAQSLASDLLKNYQLNDDAIKAVAWDQRHEVLEGTNLLVNTTSLGMKNQPELDLDLHNLPESAVVNDIVYNPLTTKLLENANASGNKIVDGLGMLIHQAVPGFEAWFGMKPEVTQELRKMLIDLC